MSQTKVNLGRVPKERGEYSATAKYYKDNIVEYGGSAYIASPTSSVNDGNDGTTDNPEYYLKNRVPFVTDPNTANAGWRIFASGRHVFSTGEDISSVGIDDEPINGSENLVKSGGVAEALKSKIDVQPSESADLNILDNEGYIIAQLKDGHIKVKNFDSSEDATPESRGLMSAEDKGKLDDSVEKLDTIEEGAQVNDTKVINTESADLNIDDEAGNVLVKFEDGHIKTKNFDSSKNALSEEDVAKVGTVEEGAQVNDVNTNTTMLADFEVSDENGNVLMQLNNGHVKTKNFDSEKVALEVSYPAFMAGQISDNGSTIQSSDTLLHTNYIRVNAGDIVRIKDKSKIDSIKVYAYTYPNGSSAYITEWITDDYIVPSDKNFIRIMGKPSVSDPLYINGVIYGNSAFVGNVHIIHHSDIKDETKFIGSTIPSGWYVSNESEFSTVPENENPNTNTGSALTLKQIYDKLQELATDYSDYFKLEQIGYDSSYGKEPLNHNYDAQFADWMDGEGKLAIPVYRYVLEPPSPTYLYSLAKNGDETIPTVYMQFGTHASEKPCIRALMNFLIHVCRDWKNNDFLTYIRWNVRIVGIPVLVPYSYIDNTSDGLVNGGRCNYNGINVNRNCYDGGIWDTYEYQEPGGNNSKGDSALSESETRIAYRNMLKYADSVAFIDWHTHGNTTTWDKITWVEIPRIAKQGNIASLIGVDLIRGLTSSGFRHHKLPYPLTENSGGETVTKDYIGKVSSSNNPSFTSIHYDLPSAPSGTIEALHRYYNNGAGGDIYNTYTDCMNEEFVVNAILSSIKQNIINK